MTTFKKTARIFILSAPSRGGKDAVVRGLKEYHSLNLSHVISYTTRKRRTNERHGKVYHFISREKFQEMVTSGVFIEWVTHNHEYYGIPKKSILSSMQRGHHVLLQVNLRGARKVKKMWPQETVTIFLRPEKLLDLAKRFDPKNFTARQVRERLAIARQEIANATWCDHVIVNRDGKLTETVQEVARVIKKEIGITRLVPQ